MPKKGRQATRTTPGFTGPFKGNAQQGTLFDVRTLPKTGEEIGPRGYSLNRSRQFNDIIQSRPGYGMRAGQVAFGVKHEVAPDAVEDTGGRQTRPAVRPQMHPFGPSHETLPETEGVPKTPLHQVLARARSKLIDTLARSTIKPEHLQGLSDINLSPMHPDRAGAYHSPKSGSAITKVQLHTTSGSSESLGGSYREPEPWTHEDAPPRTKQPQQRGPVDPDTEMTLLHEIGHHVSEQQGTPHSEYKTPPQMGAEEGYADRFNIEHYREDPRNPRWRHASDPREHTYLARGGPRDWQKFSVSPISSYRKQLGAENEPPDRPNENTFKSQTDEEMWRRPMLDTFSGKGVFDTAPKRWGESHEDYQKRIATQDPESQRREAYEKAGQKAAASRGTWRQERAEIKRRWGIRRGTLGRQWQQRDA